MEYIQNIASTLKPEHPCVQPSKDGTPGKKAPEPAANGAVLPDSDAQPMATDDAAPDSLAFDPMAEPASRVDAVGTATPVEDFEALLDRGLADRAFEQLHAVVFKLVDTSVAGRWATCSAQHAHLWLLSHARRLL